MSDEQPRYDFMIENILGDGTVLPRGEHLSISRDYDTDPAKHFPVLLYQPPHLAEDDHTHYHIHLEDGAAERLYEWLKKYLGK